MGGIHEPLLRFSGYKFAISKCESVILDCNFVITNCKVCNLSYESVITSYDCYFEMRLCHFKF